MAAPEKRTDVSYHIGKTQARRVTYQGDMSSPKDKGKVIQLAGKRYVAAGSRSEPGAVGLMKPSMRRITTTAQECQHGLPRGRFYPTALQ